MDDYTEIVASVPPTIELVAIQNNSNITVDTPIYFLVKDNALISGVYYTLDKSPENIFLKHVKKYNNELFSDGVKNNVYKIMPNATGHRWAAGLHNMTLTASDAAGNLVNAGYSFTII
jgi:hypothetical protein